jgi:hypothetical protein
MMKSPDSTTTRSINGMTEQDRPIDVTGSANASSDQPVGIDENASGT